MNCIEGIGTASLALRVPSDAVNMGIGFDSFPAFF